MNGGSLADYIGNGPAMAVFVVFLVGVACVFYKQRKGMWPWQSWKK